MLEIIVGDALTELRKLPSESVHCCVTSPPYWGLRDYSVEGQLGLEKTPEEYVAKMVHIFREVRRVLRKDGTLWLNLGDSYCNAGSSRNGEGLDGNQRGGAKGEEVGYKKRDPRYALREHGIKHKDLIGIPWRVAFALQADGWYLRQDIIWAKPNPMPESVTDRCTKAHEYMFLLTKSPRYFYDAEAIKERSEYPDDNRKSRSDNGDKRFPTGLVAGIRPGNATYGNRNKRSVWTVATAPYPEAHFATYPPDLIKPCILAGTSAKGCCAKCGAPWERIIKRTGWPDPAENNDDQGRMKGSGVIATDTGRRKELSGARHAAFKRENPDKTLGWQPTCECKTLDSTGRELERLIPCTVLDPFAGSGTTGEVALELGRKAILIELNPKYAELSHQRCDITPGLALA